MDERCNSRLNPRSRLLLSEFEKWRAIPANDPAKAALLAQQAQELGIMSYDEDVFAQSNPAMFEDWAMALMAHSVCRLVR
jgi:hypothetical protein